MVTTIYSSFLTLLIVCSSVSASLFIVQSVNKATDLPRDAGVCWTRPVGRFAPLGLYCSVKGRINQHLFHRLHLCRYSEDNGEMNMWDWAAADCWERSCERSGVRSHVCTSPLAFSGCVRYQGGSLLYIVLYVAGGVSLSDLWLPKQRLGVMLCAHNQSCWL